jgi:hypothetical protein
VTLRQLEIFLAVARAGSFRRAAERLALSQPALSQQIKELERRLDSPLFDRLGRSIGLTQASGTPEGERRLDAVTLWGHGGRLDFRLGLATMASEEWVDHPGGGKRIDRWLIRVARDGRLLSAAHRVMLSPLNGRIVEIQADELWATEEPAMRKFSELVGLWAAFEPPASTTSTPPSPAVSSVLRSSALSSKIFSVLIGP